MSAAKNSVTEDLRRQILRDADFLVETERADMLQITLSFQSLVCRERHVWIDTGSDEDEGGFLIDLEDWTYEATWDNTVATLRAPPDASIARDVTHAWLRCEPLEACLQRCPQCKIDVK